MGNGIGRRGFITLIEVLILILVAGITLAANDRFFNRRHTCSTSPKKACVNNMKCVDGAVELYLMEKNLDAGTPIDLPTLKREGYLKYEPTCPTGGHYAIRVDAGSIPGASVSVVRCSIHQGIDDTTSGL